MIQLLALVARIVAKEILSCFVVAVGFSRYS
jgi:hypothetical protein